MVLNLLTFKEGSFDFSTSKIHTQGRIQDFKLGGGAHLKKLRRAEGGAKIFGVFRVKNHDFTPKNHIFPILGRAREIFGVFHVKNPDTSCYNFRK